MEMHQPSMKPRPEMPTAFQFPMNSDGNMMPHPMSARSQIALQHPAEHIITQAREHEESFHKSALLLAQGPAGQMTRAMELQAASRVGRLPFLQGSNFQHDVLTGRDEEIDFDDVFAMNPRFAEYSVHPHTVMDQAKHNFYL